MKFKNKVVLITGGASGIGRETAIQFVQQGAKIGIFDLDQKKIESVQKQIMSYCDAEGVGVVIECKHLCMMMRGVEKQNSLMTTSSVLGSFHNDQPTRLEFMTLIGKRL